MVSDIQRHQFTEDGTAIPNIQESGHMQRPERPFSECLRTTYGTAVDKIGQSIEGLKTAVEVSELAKKYHIEMPITEQVNNVLQSLCSPHEAVKNLLRREQVSEV